MDGDILITHAESGQLPNGTVGLTDIRHPQLQILGVEVCTPLLGCLLQNSKIRAPGTPLCTQHALRESYCFPGKEGSGRQEYSPPHS